jgi:hypothetical protein
MDHTWLMSKHHDPYSSLCGRFLEAFNGLKNVLRCLTSQVKEHECDILSLEIMARAGYDPIYALRLYDILARHEEHQILYPGCSCHSSSITAPHWLGTATRMGSVSHYCPGISSSPWRPPMNTAIHSDMNSASSWRAAHDGENAFSIFSFLMPQNLSSSDNDTKMKRENEYFRQLAMERWWHSTHPPSRARQQYLIESLYEVREKFRESEKLRTKPIKRFRYEMVRRRESTNDHVELVTRIQLVRHNAIHRLRRETSQFSYGVGLRILIEWAHRCLVWIRSLR